MGDPFQLALCVSIAFSGNLLGNSIKGRAWKQEPCFFALLCAIFFAAVGQFAVYSATSLAHLDNSAPLYREVFWKFTAIEISLSFVCLCEQLDCVRFGVFGGVTLGGLLWVYPVEVKEFATVALVLVLFSALLSIFQKNRLFLYGLGVLWIPWLLPYLLPVFPKMYAVIPDYAAALAVLLWWKVPTVTAE